ncbi:hypothetical protein GCM10020358_79550 [Amorphoplanes nipponensis]|uniref:Uncharacterized protein n=1 Tax=Actinoplanes nipponensis TaxID=135950 RepID=A0A919MYE6_9ACTN|nr:PQQ-like beta-propeller repeat protein [Actinoplanes nipponensis]GIE54470.1 hypothetical protein Ani05nite_80040 [Actinoplanes nipponensis]
MLFFQFARDSLRTSSRRLLTAGVAAAVALVSGAAPAPAVSAGPGKAPLFNGSVYAVAYRGSTVYVGGSFTSVGWGGRSYDRQRLAAFDVSSGTLLSWSPAADATVRALAVSGSAVYAGGDFHRVSGLRRDALARIDATTGAVGTFSHVVTGAPYALAAGHGRLYVAGSFASVDGVPRPNLAAFALAGGRLDRTWRAGADDSVHALALSGSRLYAGGAFHKVNGAAGTLRIAALSATSGRVLSTFRPNAPAQVNALATDPNGVYAATGGQGGKVLAYSSAGAARWRRTFDGDTVAVAALGGIVYVGGHFDRACLTNRNGSQGACTDGAVDRVKLAAIDRRGGLTSWAPRANGVIGVRALAVDRARMGIAAGGDFTTINGQNRKRLAFF